MTANWATRGGVGADVLQQVQDGLTVDMIMTPRDDFLECTCNETARAVMLRNKANFSFIPVVNETRRIIGLYDAERWFNKEAPFEQIGDGFQPLSEDIVIGADASIVEFVKKADEYPTCLVVSRDQVAGLVTLSDLQQLPVRAALFTLITSLEMAMAMRIEKEWSGDDVLGWLELLRPKQRERVQSDIRAAKEKDALVTEIAFTQFKDKATIIVNGNLASGSNKKLRKYFEDIRKLRDNIAHANYYADSKDNALQASKVVRTIFNLKDDLSSAVATH